VLSHFARMTRIYVHLAPYLKSLSDEAVHRGLPVQRPLFLHHGADSRTYAIQDSYLYGPAVLVAPVWQAAQAERKLYLPQGTTWVHAWTGETFTGGRDITVAAPLGQPPVFYDSVSAFAPLFAGLRDM
jgi:alpha-glucosidase